MSPALEATARFTSEAMIHWANATHACTCEVDVETGHVTLTRYIVSEDVGPMINPNVVEGQIAGGTVQGIGGALLENMAYDDDGKPAGLNVCRLPTADRHRGPADRVRPRRDPRTGRRRIQGLRRRRGHRVDARGDQRHQRRAGPLGVTLTRLPASPAAIVELIEQASTGVPGGPLSVELNNEFRVAVPTAKTWEVLTDVERVAPVHPGRPTCCRSTATSSPVR